MHSKSFSQKLPRLKSLLCGWLGRPQFWHLFSARIGQFHQTLKPFSRMASLFPESNHNLGDRRQLQQQLQQQIALRETIQRIRRVLVAEDVHKLAVQELLDFFQADWIFLLEKSAFCWQLVNQASYPFSADTALDMSLDLEPMAARLRQASPITIDQKSVRQVPGYRQWLSQFPGSWLFVPIRFPQTDEPWGLVAIGCKDGANIWALAQQQQAQILVDEIAIALHHSLLYEQLKEDNRNFRSLALTDSLTGLANRRQFDDYFEGQWQHLTQEQQPLTLILCDIDYFKRYNDSYGHPTGDVCLAKVSDVLTHCIRRPANLVARYGGEEFAVVLPNTGTEEGHRLALEIKTHLAALSIPHCSSSVSDAVTLTMGIATVVPKRRQAPQELIQAADLALYHAKQQGRDRIYVHAHYYVYGNEKSVSGPD